MSKPRAYWYHMVRDIIQRYHTLRHGQGIQDRCFARAIEGSLEEIERLPDGADRVRAVTLVLIDHTHTPSSAAIVLQRPERTVIQWTADFVYRVGYKAGF